MTLRAACSRLASFSDFQASDCGCDCGLSQEVAEDLLDDASDLVYALSGGTIFGECEGTLRPCRTCWCEHCIGCCSIDVIPLRQDAIAITEVVIDGEVLAPENYTLLPRGRLQKISTNGERPERWPCCQKLYRALDEEDTFGITYTFGQASQPAWVRNAVIELACDMGTHFTARNGELPANTTSVTYANTTLTLDSRADLLREQATFGQFPAVAQLLGLVGPGVRSMAYSPSGATAWSFPLS
jgi:hypothetical protein